MSITDYHRRMMEAANDPRVIREREANALAMEACRALLKMPPIFRDYTGSDWDTCACCKEPADEYHIKKGFQSHEPDCPVVLAQRAIARAEGGAD